MKQVITGLCLAFLLASCRSENRIIVSPVFIDSLISDFDDSATRLSLEKELQFWKNRIDPANPGLINEMKYASALVQRFQAYGDINDLVSADSMLSIADKTFNYTQASPRMMLVHISIMRHRFKTADSLLQQARKLGIKKYESAATGFDVAFELGHYMLAENELKKIAAPNDYGYQFRSAKLAHFKGKMDSAIASMRLAGELEKHNKTLQQAALSNQADLHLHNGDLQQAGKLYEQSIRLGNSYLHSLMRLGWIALVHDQQDSLAEKIFRFVQNKTRSPDVIFRLVQVADAKGDSVRQKKYANEFVYIVETPAYGDMYNKYLLELYSGILQEPAKAEAIARKELLNRATPQTYAWLTWALHCNNKKAEAARTYKTHVSGKPLEGIELFWMGKYMQAIGKGYNAQQYFKAAKKNRYDLSPAMQIELEQ